MTIASVGPEAGCIFWRTDTNLLGGQTTPTLRCLQAHPHALCGDCSGIQKPEVRLPLVWRVHQSTPRHRRRRSFHDRPNETSSIQFIFSPKFFWGKFSADGTNHWLALSPFSHRNLRTVRGSQPAHPLE